MPKKNILIIGSGGREHALAWKLSQSHHVAQVYVSPGNGGAENSVGIAAADFEGLSSLAFDKECFTVVGPEDPLANGIVDYFRAKGLTIYGPTKQAAVLEASKVFAKQFMKKYGILTAEFKTFDSEVQAREYLSGCSYPRVVKADGLCQGKGVFVCQNRDEALTAMKSLMIKKIFGEAGRRIVVEEFLVGEEASFMAITDGKSVKVFASSQDYKRAYDNDEGPNTGGMGAYSPAPVLSPELEEQITSKILEKTLSGLSSEGTYFSGILYIALMIVGNQPYVLEYNVRFGDPEILPVLMRMRSDLFPYLEACTTGELGDLSDLEFDPRPAVSVVMASKGYPGKYEKGKKITGIESAESMEDVVVFHAGTIRDDSDVYTNGGRVLGVTAIGPDFPRVIAKCYSAVDRISWDGEHHRQDIGSRALERVKSASHA